MSRSLVGSSSSSTLGSAMRTRVSCRRRRSPPERSPTGVRWRAGVKPRRSASWEALSSMSPNATRAATSSIASSTRWSSGRSSSSCLSHPMRTVLPSLRRPAARGASPARARRSVVLPEPLTPTRPSRSPGASRQVRSSTRVRPSGASRRASSSSITTLPSLRAAKLDRRSESRGGGTSLINASAASMRYRGLEVRAGAPRRSQASSLRMRFCRRDSEAAACRSRSARAKTQSLYPPSNCSTRPSTTSQVWVATVSRNHRSWVTTTRAEDRARRWSASHCTPSTSRWLVGSSRTSRSRSWTSAAARETRRRSPPDRSSTAVSRPRSWMPIPSSTARIRGSPAHS